MGRRCPDQKIAAVDQDATIMESHKQEAKAPYEGKRGYQPMLAYAGLPSTVNQFPTGRIGTLIDGL